MPTCTSSWLGVVGSVPAWHRRSRAKVTRSRSSTGTEGVPAAARRLRRQDRRRASASTATRLKAAGIEEAAALAAVTNGDNSNIVVARVAREAFSIERVVARIYDSRRAQIYERLGIPTVATVSWTTERVLRKILPDTHAVEWVDPSAKVCMVERTVPTHWGGRLLSELEIARHVPAGRRGPAGRSLAARPPAGRPGGRRGVGGRGRRPHGRVRSDAARSSPDTGAQH